MTDQPASTHDLLMAYIADAPRYTPVEMPLSFLQPVEYNPRDIDDKEFEALKISIFQDPNFSKARPALINIHPGREGRIIAGEKRYLAHKALGKASMYVMLVDADVNQEKAWNLKDNHHQGRWNEAKRKEVLFSLRDSGFEMESLGYSPGALVDVMGDMAISPSSDPENKGTTPRARVKQGTEIECPSCHTVFRYMVEQKEEA